MILFTRRYHDSDCRTTVFTSFLFTIILTIGSFDGRDILLFDDLHLNDFNNKHI